MDSIDGALTEAWNRLEARVRGDRVEAVRRALRRTRPLLTRPIRPWCLCLRADDRRLSMQACVPKYLPEERLPHDIVVFSGTIRELCKPVNIPWPGWDWERPAYALGRHPESLRSWIKRGVFQVSYRNAFSMGKRGKPVPEIWCHGPLDPNADLGRAPDPVWGTLWQYHWNSVPDGLEFALRRVPVGRRDPRDRASGTRHVGWQFVCPGLGQILKAASSQSSTWGEEAAGADDEDYPRAPTACGRKVDRLYLPLRPWTMLDALGGEDPLDVTFRFPFRAGSCVRSDADGGSACRVLREDGERGTGSAGSGLRDSISLGGSFARLFRPACHVCHGVVYPSMVTHSGWNRFVAHLSAGLLYGSEVERPAGMAVERRRRYATQRRAAPQRDRVLALLQRGLTAARIGRRVGIARASVEGHVRRIYRVHGVRSRAGLFAALKIDDPRPMPRRRARVLRGLREGLTYAQIARVMRISHAGVSGHVRALYRRYGVRGRAALLARVAGERISRLANRQIGGLADRQICKAAT
ncbi:MAG: LuxR C-terminal-related transcriptional regulator [Phycisphaerales bacterium]